MCETIIGFTCCLYINLSASANILSWHLLRWLLYCSLLPRLVKYSSEENKISACSIDNTFSNKRFTFFELRKAFELI